jgi:cytochrome subunit of sulfide dehydrogenase
MFLSKRKTIMTEKITTYTILLVTLLMMSMTTIAKEDYPPLVVGTCITCHGIGGSSVGPANPTIASFDSETLVDIMKDYRNDERPSTIMGRIAKGYTNKDFQVMADYFAKQAAVRYPQTVDAEKVNNGSKLHEKYCERCHKNEGNTDKDGTGILAGQWMPYLQFTLADLYQGKRDMPKKMKKRMVRMVKNHSEESFEDIIHFYGSQSNSE